MPIFFKGTKYAFPPKWWKIHWKPNWLKWEIEMRNEHVVGDQAEQKDWLKICGVAFCVVARKESTMLGGRWNVSSQKWEWTPYTHIRGKDNPVYGDILFETENGQEFYAFLRIDRNKKEYTWIFKTTEGDEIARETIPYNPKRKKMIARQVNPYGGGTLPTLSTHVFTSKNIPL